MNRNPTKSGKTTCRLCGLFLFALLPGCASRPPLVAWQDALTSYIAREGHGDPMVIRDLPELRSPHRARPAQIVFGEIGIGGESGAPRDVQGVFVGQRPVAGSNWFFFVVGVMERKSRGYTQLEDLRLVAFTPRRNQLCWRLSPRDPRISDVYLATRSASGILDRGRVRGAAFPHGLDVYELDVNGKIATVRERRSGAGWELTFDAPSTKTQSKESGAVRTVSALSEVR